MGHSKYIGEINKDATTITEIVENIYKMMKDVEKLQQLEKAGKRKVKLIVSLNPIYIEIADPSAEPHVTRNSLVETK